MARHATLSDFEGGTLYTQYRKYPFFAERADLLRSRYQPGQVGRVLVAGCGWGFLVDELTSHGYNSWGVDAAVYARDRGRALLPAAVAGRLLLGDVLVRTQMDAIRAAAGLRASERFGLVITEDLLPVLTDAEARTALTELRRIGASLFHIVTPGDARDPAKIAPLNWKSISAWRALIGAGEPILDAETGRVHE